MLVISRRPEEQIRIGQNITVRVLGIVGNSVRLGISAPRSVAVHREEVFQSIQHENQEARQAPDGVDGLL
jgi:carbon storage regulator